MSYHSSSLPIYNSHSAYKGPASSQATTSTAIILQCDNRRQRAYEKQRVFRDNVNISHPGPLYDLAVARKKLEDSMQELVNHFDQTTPLPTQARQTCSNIREDIYQFVDLVETLIVSHKASSMALRNIAMGHVTGNPVVLIRKAIEALRTAREALASVADSLQTRAVILEEAMSQTPGYVARFGYALLNYKVPLWAGCATPPVGIIASVFNFSNVQQVVGPAATIGLAFSLAGVFFAASGPLKEACVDREAYASIDVGKEHVKAINAGLATLEAVFRSLENHWAKNHARDLKSELDKIHAQPNQAVLSVCACLDRQVNELEEVKGIMRMRFALIPPRAKRELIAAEEKAKKAARKQLQLPAFMNMA